MLEEEFQALVPSLLVLSFQSIEGCFLYLNIQASYFFLRARDDLILASVFTASVGSNDIARRNTSGF